MTPWSSALRSNSKSSSSDPSPFFFFGLLQALSSSSGATFFFPNKPPFAAFFSRARLSFSSFLRRAFCSGVSSGSGSQNESSFFAAPSSREMTADAMALDTNAPELAYCASISAMIPCASDAQISRTSESAICLHMASLRNAPWRVCSRLLSRKEYSVGCVATCTQNTYDVSTLIARTVRVERNAPC